jgi:hypothetical protein
MVDAEGGLHRLRQPTFATPREVTALRGPPAPQAEWQALLDAAGFDSIARGSPGNMTCSLRRRGPQGEHEVLWSGDRPLTGLPPQLRRVVEALQALARKRSPP